MPYFEIAEHSQDYQQNIICSGSCNKAISNKQAMVLCSSCLKMYHPACKGVIGTAKIKKASECNWICSPACPKPSTSSNVQTDIPATATGQSISYDAATTYLLSRMDAQFAELKSLISEVRLSQDFICKEFEDISAKSKIIAEENAALSKRYEILYQTYRKHNERLNIVEAQLDIPLQKEHANNIIICGVPQDVPNIRDFIVDNIHSVSSEARVTEIKKMYHHPKSKSTLKNAFIITLNSLEMKNEVLSKYKTHRISRTSTQPSSSYQNNIRIMNHFTKFQSKLYSEAKKLQYTHNYKYLWAKDNKIFLRKTSDSNINHIFCLNDIFRLGNCSMDNQHIDSLVTSVPAQT